MNELIVLTFMTKKPQTSTLRFLRQGTLISGLMENTDKNKYPHISRGQNVPFRNLWCAVAHRRSHMKPVFLL